MQIRIGDRIRWQRADGVVYGKVLEVHEPGKSPIVTQHYRAKLKIDGWAGTTWETIGHNFSLVTERDEEIVQSTRTAAGFKVRTRDGKAYNVNPIREGANDPEHGVSIAHYRREATAYNVTEG